MTMTTLAMNTDSLMMTSIDLGASFGYIGLTNLVQKAPHVYTHIKCKDTLRVLFGNPEANCIVVCNKYDQPVGIVDCDKFYLRLNGRMAMDGLYMESITKLMNRNPLIVEIESTIQAVREIVASRVESVRGDYVIVTEQGKFSGVIKGASFMSI